MPNLKYRVFPTNHPFVTNDNGSVSNVVLASFGIGTPENPKFVVVPTMVEGKQLDAKEAISLASSKGLKNYPTFTSQEEADVWARENHANINERGWLMSKDDKKKVKK